MIDVAHPRDLVMIGAIFGLAAFIWSGWAQEAPPKGLVFRIVLAGLGVAGLALAVPSILTAIGNWSEPSAFTSGTSAFTLYLIVFWVEVIIGAVASFFLIRTLFCFRLEKTKQNIQCRNHVFSLRESLL